MDQHSRRLLDLLKQQEKRRRLQEREMNPTGSPGLDKAYIATKFIRGIYDELQQKSAMDKLTRSAEAQTAVEARNKAINQAVSVYRAGIEVSPEMAQAAGMPQLAGMAPPQPRASNRYIDEEVRYDPGSKGYKKYVVMYDRATGQKLSESEAGMGFGKGAFHGVDANNNVYIYDPVSGATKYVTDETGSPIQARPPTALINLDTKVGMQLPSTIGQVDDVLFPTKDRRGKPVFDDDKAAYLLQLGLTEDLKSYIKSMRKKYQKGPGFMVNDDSGNLLKPKDGAPPKKDDDTIPGSY